MSELFSCLRNFCTSVVLAWKPSRLQGRILAMISCTNQSCINTLWYVIHCQPRKERYAADAIKKYLGLCVYIPEYTQTQHGIIKHLPLFPGYIFVQADLQKVPLSQINTTPGVLRLVAFGGDPQPVPHYMIEEFRERLKQMDILQREPFRPGDVVRVKQSGPLQDLEMIFMGPMTASRRVCVLLNFLGRLKQVHLDQETLEKVPPRTTSEKQEVAVYHRRERYTRGKGRKVKHST